MTYVIAQPCVDLKDRGCVEECPVDCIYEGKRMLYIHPDECVDCGACEPVCPVEAIFYEDDTPEEWKEYYNANVDFFSDLGSPGGAAKLGVIDKDHPLIEALAAARTRRVSLPVSSAQRRRGLAAGLPDFPWDTLAAARATARSPSGRHRRPVHRHADRSDPRTGPGSPESGRRQSRATRSPPAPARCARRSRPICAAAGGPSGCEPTATLPVIGTKELVAWLPTLLGLGPDDLVVYPTMAYPTYQVGAVIAGCRTLACDDLDELGDQRPALVWINSPSNPTGQVLAPEVLAARVRTARERGAIVLSDECYGEFGWDAEPVSVLHPSICGGDHEGCSRCTRCPSDRTSPDTAPASSPAMINWSPSCWRSASMPA